MYATYIRKSSVCCQCGLVLIHFCTVPAEAVHFCCQQESELFASRIFLWEASQGARGARVPVPTLQSLLGRDRQLPVAEPPASSRDLHGPSDERTLLLILERCSPL